MLIRGEIGVLLNKYTLKHYMKVFLSLAALLQTIYAFVTEDWSETVSHEDRLLLRLSTIWTGVNQKPQMCFSNSSSRMLRRYKRSQGKTPWPKVSDTSDAIEIKPDAPFINVTP